MKPNGAKWAGQVSVAEALANELRRRILRNDFSDGSMLPTQDKLIEEFGVSHPSLREALRILETEGLVTVRRGNVGGAYVHLPGIGTAAYNLGIALHANQTDIHDLGTALVAVEPLCARLCAQRPDRLDVVVPVLRDLVDQASSSVDQDVQFTHVARKFHEALVSLCGNQTLQHVVLSLVTLWTAQEEAWVKGMTASGEAPTLKERHEVITVHRRLFEAIESGDGRRAEHISSAHLEATQTYFSSHRADQIVDATTVRDLY